MSNMRRKNAFKDATPVTVTLTTTLGRLNALIDNPHLLTEDRQGANYANAVRAGCRDLMEARRAHLEGQEAAVEGGEA